MVNHRQLIKVPLLEDGAPSVSNIVNHRQLIKVPLLEDGAPSVSNGAYVVNHRQLIGQQSQPAR